MKNGRVAKWQGNKVTLPLCNSATFATLGHSSRFLSRLCPRIPQLTERKREALIRIGQHRINREIADLLILSEKTIRNHVANIFTKLQVADRTEAILLARDAGLSSSPPPVAPHQQSRIPI